VRELEQLKQNSYSEMNKPAESTATTAAPQHSETKQAQYQIKWRDLNLYALTSFSVVPILIGVLAIYSNLDDVLPDHYINQIFSRFSQQTAMVIIFDVVCLILVAIVAAYLLIIQRYYHFTIVHQGSQL